VYIELDSISPPICNRSSETRNDGGSWPSTATSRFRMCISDYLKITLSLRSIGEKCKNGCSAKTSQITQDRHLDRLILRLCERQILRRDAFSRVPSEYFHRTREASTFRSG